jgi:hypothetical protein
MSLVAQLVSLNMCKTLRSMGSNFEIYQTYITYPFFSVYTSMVAQSLEFEKT